MSRQKRKAPDKKVQKRRNVLLTGVSAAANLASTHPAATGGSMVFGIVFSFVAANALWYQPGFHPHPLLDTRAAFDAYAARAAAIESTGDEGVTTFRIERQVKPAAKPDNIGVTAKAPSGSDVIVKDTETGQVTALPGDQDMVSQIQQNLARRGLYDGGVDGKMGPKTEAAIIFYQETRGMEVTGEPSVAVLQALKADNAEFNILPTERPTQDITGGIVRKKPAGDPLAGIIKQVAANDAAPAAAKPLSKPQAKAASKNTQKMPMPDLVLQIQKGLAKLSYSDIAVDGIMGTQTADAISHFEKHYRLPITGKPNMLVLEKLKQIGAL